MVRAFGAALAAAVGFLLLGGAPVSAAPATYRPTPCTGDFTGVAQRVECGMLAVDEVRGTPSPRRVALPVAIVRALAPRPGLPPVVYLHGGPGGGAIENLPRLLRSPVGRELFAQDQDWIIFDQRGGGLSSPLLDCGKAALNDAGPLSSGAADMLAACGQRYSASGVDLSRFNSAEVARDLQDLRAALGLRQVDLFGVSYGTRVGFAVLTHAPEGVRAAVLDSVWPPEATWAEHGPQMISDAVRVLLARCAAQAACAARYPDVGQRLDRLARAFLAGPQAVGTKRYTADDLGGFLMDAIYDPEGARGLPRDIDKLSRGDYGPLDQAIAERSGYAEGQHLAFLCKEEFPFERRDHVADGTAGDPVAQLSVASFQRYFDVCRSYAVGAPDPVESRPVASAVPTLFLSAEIDPGCPPALAEAAARRFSSGRFVMVPNTTHGVSRNSACGRRMIRAFLRNPAAPVDATCVHREHDSFAFTTE